MKQQANQRANECVHCGRPVADTGYLCHSENNSCTALAAGHLDFIASNAGELEVTITRRDKLGDGTGRTTETPLPFNATASDTARDIRTAILGLAAQINNTRRLAITDDPTRRAITRAKAGSAAELAAAARYIKTHLRWLRHQPIAADAYTTIDDASRALARTIDTHPALTDLGNCGTPDCDGRLLAAGGARYVRCHSCGQVASVAETTGLLLEWARDRLFTADELSSLLSKWHTRKRIPPGTIRSWGTRGLLPRKGRDGNAWLYALGDAIDTADRLQPAPSAEQELAA